MKIRLISNMYPSQKDRLFGIFVKKSSLLLKNEGVDFVSSIVIQGKTKGPLRKLFRYFVYYTKGFFSLMAHSADLTYIHFLTHNIPLVVLFVNFQQKPVIVNLHGTDIEDLKPGGFLEKIQRHLLKKVDEIIVPSQYFKEKAIERYPEIDTPFYVYPSAGIDTKLFKPKPHKKSAPPLKLAYVSRIDKGKGWQDFIGIVEQLNQAGIESRAKIAGAGKEEKAMKSRIENSPWQHCFEYLGFQEKQDLAQIYRETTIFIFPTELAESLGLVGLEAMACGAVTLARKKGGPTGYIQHGQNGFLFQNQAEAVDLLKDFLNFPEKKQQAITENAITTAQKFDGKHVSRKLVQNLSRYVAQT